MDGGAINTAESRWRRLIGRGYHWRILALLPLLTLAAAQTLTRIYLFYNYGFITISGTLLHALLISVVWAAVCALTLAWDGATRAARGPAIAATIALALIHLGATILDLYFLASYQSMRTVAFSPLLLVFHPSVGRAFLASAGLPEAELVTTILILAVVHIAFYLPAAFTFAIWLRERREAIAAGTAPWLVRRLLPVTAVWAGGFGAFLVLMPQALVQREPYINVLKQDLQMAPAGMMLPRGRAAPLLVRTAVAPRPRPLIVIVVDALRADRVRTHMPFVQSLIDRGTARSADHAFSTCTFSFCGIVSILSGRWWDDFGDTPATLPDMLAPYGYRSTYLLSGDHSGFGSLRESYGNNLTRYVDDASRVRHGNDDWNLIGWLRASAFPDPRYSFLYLHLMSAHGGAYLGNKPPVTMWDRLVNFIDWGKATREYRVTYDAGVEKADRVIRALFAELRTKGLLDDAVVIITADHGERIGDGGMIGHGGAADATSISIPMIVIDPVKRPGPIRLASQIDIAPTFLAAIGAPVPPGLQGIPLYQGQRRKAAPFGTAEDAGIVRVVGGAPVFTRHPR